MRSYRTLSRCMFVIAVAAAGGCFDDATTETASAVGNGNGGGPTAGPVHGAIFTTTVDGTRVNANIYAAKGDVYLDGGPGNNAPSSAAALPAGDYYFQVTDPSGKTLLSTDAIACRKVRINAAGVIDLVYPSSCQHATGIDSDHASLGAITVQLLPYLDTPNNGGEYKVWMTPVAAYTGSGPWHGFVHNSSKTDNFKIKMPAPDEPPTPVCGDHHVDSGEACDDGNMVNDDGCSSTCSIEVPPPAPSCGDGQVDSGESCDDGNTSNGDGCSASCAVEPPPPHACCGDGHVDAGEACDDGNTVGGDGCSATCVVEPPPPPSCCGNGILEAGEACDDGNTNSEDGCSAVCHLETSTTSADASYCANCAASKSLY